VLIMVYGLILLRGCIRFAGHQMRLTPGEAVLHPSPCPMVRGVMPLSMVDTLFELCSPFLKGGNSTFIAAIENIGHSNNNDSNGTNRKMGSK